jgi:hypothetical protein
MSTPQAPQPAKLVIGFFTNNKMMIRTVVQDLCDAFGPIDLTSAWFSFDYTCYYEPEMGKPLFRRMFAFKTLIRQSELSDIKLLTNDIEKKYIKDGSRMVNIDPGYMVLPRFVLASGKNFAHRIYIGKGVYADLTLIFVKGKFQTLPWTYPDYAEENMLAFLTQVRNKYVFDYKRADFEET